MASFSGLNFDQSVQSSLAQQHARASTTRYRDRIAKFTMVVPTHVGFAVDRGDIAVVESWLNNATPLGMLLHSLRDGDEEYGGDLSNFRGSLIALLRAGASLHNCSRGKSAIIIMRDHLMKRATLADNEHYIACREILAGVRAQGSYKRYLRAPHREFLRFRSLLVRGRAKTNGLNERIARLPNGACWKVLSYWREDN